MDNDAKEPLLKKRYNDSHHSATSIVRTTSHCIKSTGPQLCHSPSLNYETLSGLGFPNIQTPDDELPEKTEETKVYSRRWYILVLYSLLAATQGGVWNSWGPISATAEDAFGWTDATIALLSNWGPIAYLVSGIFFSWMMDVKGMRVSCIVTGFLVAAGTALRCITFETPAVTWLMHAGQFLNGLGGPIAMAAPPILSAVWFPPKERTTATAIGTIFNYLGVGLSFIMGHVLNSVVSPVAMAGPPVVSAQWFPASQHTTATALGCFIISCGKAVDILCFRLVNAGHLVNSITSPVVMAGPPVVSANWFPPHQRTMATAVCIAISNTGLAVTYLLGPLLVPDVPTNSTNTSSFYLSFDSGSSGFSGNSSSALCLHNNETVADRIAKEKNAIAFYMYIEAGWAAAIFLLLLAYFPSKPPLPPCPSAAIQREDFLAGLKHLLTRRQFILVATVYGVSLGTLNCWSSVLDVILKPHGIDENEAGWIGFYATCSACVASLIVARFADFFSRIMKWLILCSYIIGTATFVVFALATIKVIPPSTVLFYTTIIVSKTALNAAVPLIFELACELSYPTGEGTTNGVLTIVNNIFGLIFLLVMMIPGIGSTWTNWTVVGTSGICIPLLFLMKEKYNRLEIDEHKPSLNTEIMFPSPHA